MTIVGTFISAVAVYFPLCDTVGGRSGCVYRHTGSIIDGLPGDLVFGCVALLVEVGEQEQEENAMEGNPDHETLWVVALNKQELELVHKDGDKLDHLERGQVFLPPDVLLVFRPHGGHHVVEVHDDVNECVQESEERAVATWGEFHAHPDTHGHNSVMNNV